MTQAMQRELSVIELGRRDYASVLALQEETHAARARGELPDTLLLVEHDPVITLGRAAKQEHVLATPEHLKTLGIELHEIGRGGDVTYHGPGQLVVYPILDLKPDRCDVRRYVRSLEQVMLQVAESYGLTPQRIEGMTGAFCDQRKYGALGVRISRWVTMHGIAINVSTDLDAFSLIVPCGLRTTSVTSLSREAGREISLADAQARTTEQFAQVFGYKLRRAEGA
ncbi:MAG TPA: lipoyl(octanoyl) transferase LipB [Polyangiales bacterium]|nr:lipoyl(octanoyl) transferase LipB [Polyangiales bacterium]